MSVGRRANVNSRLMNSEVERCVVGNEKLVGCEEAPYLGGVELERVLEAKSQIRKSMNLLRMAVVFLTRIEDQVRIAQVQLPCSELAADHSDATKTDDAVVFGKSCSL